MPNPPPQGARPGQTLADGRYALTARLGEGGMAGVYRAWDERLRVDRAVKVMLPDYARRKKLRQRFEREAHTMARLEHPNLIRVYDVGTQARVPFLVMELITGGTLRDWVTRNGRMPPQMAVEAVAQLCEGVAAAHDAGIVHRDIKPHNVLISQSGVCKLADFGIAHVEEDNLTRTGSTMGTMGYMPPEQRRDAKSVDVRCDVFSVAATLWFVLKDAPVLDLFLAGEDPKLLEDIPEVLHPVIRKAVSYDRDGRHDSIRDFRQDLLAAAASLPPDPRCPPLPAPEPTSPELEADWFPELAPLFDEGFIATPEPVELQGELRPPVNQAPKKIPYFMPSSPPSASPGPRVSRPPPEANHEDSLPDYVDREALSQGDRSFQVEVPPAAAPEPEPLTNGGMRAVSTVALGAATLAVFALLGLSSIAYTGVRMTQTAHTSQAAEEQLFAMLDSAGAVVNDLVSFGVARGALDQRYFAYQDARLPAEREAAADALVDALQSSSAALQGNADASPIAATLKMRIDTMVRARDDHRDATASWHSHAQTLRGRLLLLVGIVDDR